jgi:hypothetical protein
MKQNVTVALLVRLEAKPGKEVDVERFLRGGLSIVEDEPATTAWFAIRLGPSPSVSSMHFRTRRGAKRIYPAKLPRR